MTLYGYKVQRTSVPLQNPSEFPRDLKYLIYIYVLLQYRLTLTNITALVRTKAFLLFYLVTSIFTFLNNILYRRFKVFISSVTPTAHSICTFLLLTTPSIPKWHCFFSEYYSIDFILHVLPLIFQKLRKISDSLNISQCKDFGLTHNVNFLLINATNSRLYQKLKKENLHNLR